MRTKGLLSVPTSENFKCITCNVAISLYKTNCLFLWTDRQIGVVSLSLLLVVLLITQVLVSGGAALARLVEWRCRELFQRGQKEGVMVASSQLRGAMILLAKVCVASSTADGLLTDSSHAKVRSHCFVPLLIKVSLNLEITSTVCIVLCYMALYILQFRISNISPLLGQP